MTKIEWTDKTWNPVTGCTKISLGCKNCYAERMSKRLAGRYGYPEAPDNFKVTLHPERLQEPASWKKRRMVFVCSMGDLFHDNVIMSWQNKIFKTIRKCQRHTFMILTKRPDNMADFIMLKYQSQFKDGCFNNLWLGVTAETQKTANERIPILLQIPAKIKFVSCEPLLENIDLYTLGYIDWLICGGESGLKRRPMNLEWARSLRDQCREAGVPFFMKQIDKIQQIPDDLMIREYPNGRI